MQKTKQRRILRTRPVRIQNGAADQNHTQEHADKPRTRLKTQSETHHSATSREQDSTFFCSPNGLTPACQKHPWAIGSDRQTVPPNKSHGPDREHFFSSHGLKPRSIDLLVNPSPGGDGVLPLLCLLCVCISRLWLHLNSGLRPEPSMSYPAPFSVPSLVCAPAARGRALEPSSPRAREPQAHNPPAA
jgi:hypothetical protein